MWNAPLPHGTPFAMTTGCALFLIGLSIGLVIAGICLAFIAVSSDDKASPHWESYATISDDEIEIIIELVQDAIAGSGWTLCGDCYTRNLLQQLPFPMQESRPGSLSSSPSLSPRELTSPHRVDEEGYGAQNIPESRKNRHERGLWVEQEECIGRVTALSS